MNIGFTANVILRTTLIHDLTISSIRAPRKKISRRPTPPLQAPIPLVIQRIMTQPRREPDNLSTPYTASGSLNRGPLLPCFTRAQMKMAKAAMVTATEESRAGMRYLFD